MKSTYLAFFAEAPLCGIDPHPAYAPNETIDSFDANGFAEALGANDDLNALREETIEDHEARLDAVDNGDLEDADDADVIHRIVIHDDGQIDVYEIDAEEPFAHISMAAIYDAFGMTYPEIAQ